MTLIARAKQPFPIWSEKNAVLFHGLMINISDQCPTFGEIVLPNGVFRIVVRFLEKDLKTWYLQKQSKLNSTFWVDLFSNDRNSYLSHCNRLDKQVKEARLSWQLVCKNWFLLASLDYPRFERLLQAGTKLLNQLSATHNIS